MMTLVPTRPPDEKSRFVTRVPDYRCTKCQKPTERELLTVRRVSFHEMGSQQKRKGSRVTDWLCPSCLGQDPEWNKSPKHGAFPDGAGA